MLLLAFVTVVHVGVHGSCDTDEQENADGEGEARCPYSVSFADLLVKKSVLLECFWFWLFLRSVGRWATQPDGLHARHGERGFYQEMSGLTYASVSDHVIRRATLRGGTPSFFCQVTLVEIAGRNHELADRY